ncbi:hypothetical protein SORBI_3006G250350 [Sorghum bicolor]|uniref:Uncharacterized protein n=1 Tax=Sorghum bicolor TaxID=4558 RepID=A0A1Z5RFG7_SORBI|nr:hypothetical protein SORBI_3006G250350 [Sorghum bicolor]
MCMLFDFEFEKVFQIQQLVRVNYTSPQFYWCPTEKLYGRSNKHSVSFVRHVLHTTRQAQKSQVPPRRQTATVCSVSGRRWMRTDRLLVVSTWSA